MPPSQKPTGRAVRPPQLIALLLAFLLVAGIGGILSAGMLLPAVATAGAVSTASTELFQDLPDELEIPDPSQQSVILDAEGNTLATFYAENRILVGYDEISPHMRDAVVAIEDHRFFDHNGVDLEGIMRAMVSNIGGEAPQGASTITQQYVKNVLIEESRITNNSELYVEATQTEGMAGIARKLREARYAIALEQRSSKEEILTGYLNIAQFGPSQWGVEAAAHYYFNKTAAELDIAESALLAGITQSPARWDPVRNPENALQRRNMVLRRMHNEGMITAAEYEAAREIAIDDMLDVQTTPRGCGVAGDAAFFCQYVVNEILNSDTYGETREERRQLLNRGGLVIHTTLDPDKQRAAFEAVTGTIPIGDESGVDMALSAIEPGTGHIIAMAQNSNFGQSSKDDPTATQVNYNVGQSHGGGLGFHSGSTFKVFTLIQWLREGNSLMQRINSDNRHFERSDWTISCAPEVADKWSPKNLEGAGGGYMTVMDSTRLSVNTSFVVMASQMDLCDIRDVAADMGVRSGDGAELTPMPSMILGTNNVTPLSMANAYATLASGGIACEPIAITSVTNADGEEIPVPGPRCERVLEESVVNGVNHALQTVTRPGGTGSGAHIPGRPTAGKTGTANDDKHAWFIGYTPQLSAAVWMGHADRDREMLRITINGRWYDRIWGGRLAAPTWRDFMVEAIEDMPVEQFRGASDRVIHGERITIPHVVGRSVSDAATMLENAGFSVRIAPPADSPWPQGVVSSVSPTGRALRGETVTIVPSTGQQPPPAADPRDDDDDDQERRGRDNRGNGRGGPPSGGPGDRGDDDNGGDD